MASYQSFTKETRLENWKRILSIEDGPAVARFESVPTKDAQKYAKNRVVIQDVLRTRADEHFFRSNLVRTVLRQTLVRFCAFNKIEYLQGLNEVLAPILTLDVTIVCDIEKQNSILSSSSNDSFGNEDLNVEHPFALNLVIFERLMAKLAPTTFSTLGVNAIQVQLTTFHLLLMYHEPVLATILRKEGMTPDIYAMSWLITLFGRRQPLRRALHIWDLLLQLDRPQITVYLAVALVRSRKASILNNCADVLPATLVALKFETDEEIDKVFADAIHLMQITPENVTEELAELGFNRKILEAMREKGLKDLWHRPCVLSSASDIARVLACADHSVDVLGRPAPSPRYVLLDCRHSVEKQLMDAQFIEGSVSVPLTIQEEICSLARVKSQLLEREGMDAEGTVSAADIEKTFARAVGKLSTRAAAVLSLLWASFVSGTAEEVHFAIADDSQGPYLCTNSPQSLLNTSYALPYHTACGASDSSLHQTSPGHARASANLPQYLSNSSVLASNSYAISLASALILLGFPRVSIVQAEVIHKRRMSSNENSMFTCTDSNSVSSLPIMHAEQYSSGFACVLHYLGALGVNSATVNARYSYVQTPIDHFKEFQAAALVHELRSTVLQYAHIDVDFYAEDLSTQSVSTPRPDASVSVGHLHRGPSPRAPPTQTFSSISLVGAVFNSASSNNNLSSQARQPRRHSHHGTYQSQQNLNAHLKGSEPMKKSASGSGLSSMISSLGLTTPSEGTTSRRSPISNKPGPTAHHATRSVSEGLTSTSDPVSLAPPSLNSSTTSTSSVPVSLMQAKLNCSLDVLYRLLFIMSAQKKHHICRLIVGSFFHSSVPLGRQHSPPAVASPRTSHAGVEDYLHLLGSPPDDTSNNPNNAVYYAKLEGLLTLRDTLHELNSTQRLNTTLDKNANKALSQLRLLKNSIDHTNRQSSRAAAVLMRKTTLRSTQRRLQEESHLRARGDSTSSSGGMWYTDRELSTFLHPDGANSRCSSAALRDSLSTDWDTSRVLSDDSVDHYSIG